MSLENDFGVVGDYGGMSMSPDFRGWRLRKLRLGNVKAWQRVVDLSQDKNLNPQLSLALLSSDLLYETLLEIHDRKKTGMEENIIFERKE